MFGTKEPLNSRKPNAGGYMNYTILEKRKRVRFYGGGQFKRRSLKRLTKS